MESHKDDHTCDACDLQFENNYDLKVHKTVCTKRHKMCHNSRPLTAEKEEEKNFEKY